MKVEGKKDVMMKASTDIKVIAFKLIEDTLNKPKQHNAQKQPKQQITQN